MADIETYRAEQVAEMAYRRGVHQALAWASDAIQGARSVEAAREIIGRAESTARSYREERRSEPADNLLDRIGIAASRR